MRVRNVTTVFGLSALVFVCLAAESASAQFQPGYAGPGVVYGRGSLGLTGPGAGYYPAGPTAYGQPWQPGSYGAPSYWPGMAYGPGQSYATPMYQPQAMYQSQPGYQQQPMYQAQPMYQSQPYAYQAAGAPCPPAQPISSSALTSTPPQAMPSGAPGAAPGAAPAQPASAHTVAAHDDYFEPKTITVRPGATVTWTNRGQHPHTVTFGDVDRDSGDIQPGGSFSATFPHAGTYNYHCRHHKDMRATVVVSQDAATGGAGDSTGKSY